LVTINGIQILQKGGTTVPTDDDDAVTTDATDTGLWHTIDEACELLKISKRTLWRRIQKSKLKSKQEDGRRLVFIPNTYTIDETPAEDGTVTGTPADTLNGTPEPSVQRELIQQLRAENEYLRNELKQANDRYEQGRERSDTIIMQLTRQLGDTQKALEAHTKPWWRRLRLNKGKNENKG